MWDEDKYQESLLQPKLKELIVKYGLKRDEALDVKNEVFSCAPTHPLVAQNNLLAHVYQEMIDELKKLVEEE